MRAARPATPALSLGYLGVYPASPQDREFPAFYPDGGMEPMTGAALGKATVLTVNWPNLELVNLFKRKLDETTFGRACSTTLGCAIPSWANGATIYVPGLDEQMWHPLARGRLTERNIVVFEGHQHHVCRALTRAWRTIGPFVNGVQVPMEAVD